jgi:Tfp pilus assembly protein PilF
MPLRFHSLLVLLATGLATAQNPKKAPVSPEEKRFGEIVLEVRRLTSARQHQQALEKLSEAEALRPNSPEVHMVRGNIYTNAKEYEKARECFVKAESLKPGAFQVRFNLAELDYVQGNYQAASDSFAKLLSTTTGPPEAIRALMQFKIIVCQIKLNKVAEAEALANTYAFKDESPASYFAKASFAIHKGDHATANEWLGKAQKAFKPDDVAPYVDALVEARWITFKPATETKK